MRGFYISGRVRSVGSSFVEKLIGSIPRLMRMVLSYYHLIHKPKKIYPFGGLEEIVDHNPVGTNDWVYVHRLSVSKYYTV